MKRSDIEVGKTYCNSGAGRTRRTVLSFVWDKGNRLLIRFSQKGRRESAISLKAFAAWAGKEVEGDK